MNEWVEHFQHYLANGHPLAYLIAYVFGVLTSFTPCVYPMIPVTVSFMGHIGHTRKRIWVYAGVYVLGMAIIYTALGMFAVLTGRVFGQIASNSTLLFVVGGIFLAASLAMLGVIPIDKLLYRFSEQNPAGDKTGMAGAFTLGLTSGFIAAPCTVPVLGILLSYVALTKNILFGASLLFVFSLGLGTLLFIISIFSGFTRYLPRGGVWSMIVHKGMGVLMGLISIYFIIQAWRAF